MKYSKRVFLALLALVCLLTSLMPVSSFADSRSYKVRVFPGNKGQIVGADSDGVYKTSIQYSNTFTMPSVTTDAGYYVKGLRESGKNEISSPPYRVSTDQDYVVAYGVEGTQVRYTVQYLLYGTTTRLANDADFYASVGDVVISSQIDIEGYTPYLRSRRTLGPNASENILYAYYTAAATETTTTTAAAGAAVAGAGAAVAGGNAAGGAANAAAAGANAATPVQANPANPTNPGVAVAGANAVNPNAAAPAQQQYAQTEDILDLDVPLAAPEGSTTPLAPAPPAVSAPAVIQPQDSNKTGLPTWALATGGAVGVGLIALLYWYLLFYRKKKKYADIDDLFDGK